MKHPQRLKDLNPVMINFTPLINFPSNDDDWFVAKLKTKFKPSQIKRKLWTSIRIVQIVCLAVWVCMNIYNLSTLFIFGHHWIVQSPVNNFDISLYCRDTFSIGTIPIVPIDKQPFSISIRWISRVLPRDQHATPNIGEIELRWYPVSIDIYCYFVLRFLPIERSGASIKIISKTDLGWDNVISCCKNFTVYLLCLRFTNARVTNCVPYMNI